MSVHQLKDGRWLCRYPKGKDPDRPKTNKKYFGRGVDAERAAHEFNEMLGLEKKKVQRSPVFLELVNEYLSAKEHTIAKSTFTNFCIKMEGVISPRIGHIQVHKLTPAKMDEYVSERSKSVKTTTIHRELSDIRAVIRWAVSRRLIASNPLEWFSLPKRDDARIQPPTKAEFEAILACAAPHLKRAMLISYHTGLRPGKEELLPLPWNAVDFVGKTLTVMSADKGGIPVRMIPLNKTILGYLEKWYEDDKKSEMHYLIHYQGRKIDRLSKAWNAAKKRAKVLRRIRMYDIRHCFITTLLENGADLKSVSEIAGHASPEMTMKIYQHVSNDLKRKAVDLLN